MSDNVYPKQRNKKGKTMSYDIGLKNPVANETASFRQRIFAFVQKLAYAINGTTELWLNITYGYTPYYYETTKNDERFAYNELISDDRHAIVQTKYGIRGIDGKTGTESIPMLKDLISRIEQKYKKQVAANVTEPLYKMLAMAQRRPNGIWDVD